MKLNVGCGLDIRTGWVNLDSHPLPGVDVVHDVTTAPWPFDENSFDEILCQNVLEHVDYPKVLREIHRVLKPGGKVFATVPHFTSPYAYADPTHIRYFALGVFHFFTKSSERPYYFDFEFDRIDRLYLEFPKRKLLFFNYLVEKLVNFNNVTLGLYEIGPLRLFPAATIYVTLVK